MNEPEAEMEAVSTVLLGGDTMGKSQHWCNEPCASTVMRDGIMLLLWLAGRKGSIQGDE